MSTLLITEVFPPKVGGSGRYLREIYGRLSGGRLTVVAGDHPGAEAFDRSDGLRVRRLPLTLPSWGVGGARGYRRALGPLRRLVEAERVERVHAARCLPEGLLAMALRRLTGVPYLCHAFGEELEYAASSRELRWLTRRVLRRAGAVVAICRGTERVLREAWGVPADRLHVLYPGVDTSRFVPSPRDPPARDALGWGDRPVVLTVSRLQKRKGHDRMILALNDVRRAVPDVLYAIVGDGEERRSLGQLVGREGLGEHVQFLGELGDEAMVRCYQQCDLFALPNRRVGEDIEGFGIVLLEAQACGKPAIAGASGGTAEAMDVGRTGVVIPCETPHPLAETVVELLDDPDRRERMGRAARAWAVEHFDWGALARQAATLFDEVGRAGSAASRGRTTSNK